MTRADSLHDDVIALPRSLWGMGDATTLDVGKDAAQRIGITPEPVPVCR